MADTCTHLDTVNDVIAIEHRLRGLPARSARQWVHLRLCMECGHVGCCDNSPNRHATAHNHETSHPIIRSYEPGEDWWWCYPDELFFELDGAPPAPSHP